MTAGSENVTDNKPKMDRLAGIVDGASEASPEQSDSRRGSAPLIFDHSYTERQTVLRQETQWLGDKTRELHRKLATLKRVQEDIEERTRVLREKNLELLERNQQLSAGNRLLRDEVVDACAVRAEREEELRLALAHHESSWEDNAIDPVGDPREHEEP